MANKKKRVLMLNYEFPPLGGGASPVSYEIAKGYVKFGHNVDVVTMHYRSLPYYEKKDGINVYRVKCLRSKKEICHPLEQATYLIFGYFKVRKLLKKREYDACHCHFIIPTGILAYILKKLFCLEYIVTSHGSDVPGYNEDRFKFLHRFTPPLLKLICKNAKKIVTPSKYLKKLILKTISHSLETKIIHIPNGLNKKRFTPQKKKKTIVSSGRLLSRKGFQHLIRAVRDKPLNYEVHILGDGPMMSKLQQMAEKSQTPIIFHGWIDNTSDEYKNTLEQASIYVLASSKENASISLLEAMAAGCAVITTNVSGCPETLGSAGIKISPNSHDELAEKIQFLIDNPHKLRSYQLKAKKRFENKFTWAKIIDKYQRVLL